MHAIVSFQLLIVALTRKHIIARTDCVGLTSRNRITLATPLFIALPIFGPRVNNASSSLCPSQPGTTLSQAEDGTIYVTQEDGTTAPLDSQKGVPLETVESLLSLDGQQQQAQE